jgi:hypothetical protein
MNVSTDGVWIGEWICWPLVHTRHGTTSNYNAIAYLHILQFAIEHAKSSQSVTRRFRVTASNNVYCSTSVLKSSTDVEIDVLPSCKGMGFCCSIYKLCLYLPLSNNLFNNHQKDAALKDNASMFRVLFFVHKMDCVLTDGPWTFTWLHDVISHKSVLFKIHVFFS